MMNNTLAHLEMRSIVQNPKLPFYYVEQAGYGEGEKLQGVCVCVSLLEPAREFKVQCCHSCYIFLINHSSRPTLGRGRLFAPLCTNGLGCDAILLSRSNQPGGRRHRNFSIFQANISMMKLMCT